MIEKRVEELPEAVVRRFSAKKVFLEISQMFFCEICEISKNSFFYRTLLVAASELLNKSFYSTLFTYWTIILGVMVMLCNCSLMLWEIVIGFSLLFICVLSKIQEKLSRKRHFFVFLKESSKKHEWITDFFCQKQTNYSDYTLIFIFYESWWLLLLHRNNSCRKVFMDYVALVLSYWFSKFTTFMIETYFVLKIQFTFKKKDMTLFSHFEGTNYPVVIYHSDEI